MRFLAILCCLVSPNQSAAPESQILWSFSEAEVYGFFVSPDLRKVAYSTGTALVVRDRETGRELHRSEMKVPAEDLDWQVPPGRTVVCWSDDGQSVLFVEGWQGWDKNDKMQRSSRWSLLNVKSGAERPAANNYHIWAVAGERAILSGFESNQVKLYTGPLSGKGLRLVGRILDIADFGKSWRDDPDVPYMGVDNGVRSVEVAPDSRTVGVVAYAPGREGGGDDAPLLFRWTDDNLQKVAQYDKAYDFAFSPVSKEVAYLVPSWRDVGSGFSEWLTMRGTRLRVATVGGETRNLALWRGSEEEMPHWEDILWDATGAWIAVQALPLDTEERLWFAPKPRTWHFVRKADGRTFDAELADSLFSLTLGDDGGLVARSLTFDTKSGKGQALETRVSIPR